MSRQKIHSRQSRLKSWTRSLLILIIFLCMSFLPIIGTYAEEGLIDVVEVVWTDSVNRFDRRYNTVYTDRAPLGPIYLWMKVKGFDKAYDRLKKAGKLPIVHKWYRFVGQQAIFIDFTKLVGEIPLDGISSMRNTDIINLSIGREESLGRINHELLNRGYFDWRTWSGKERIFAGRWYVTIFYNDNTPVYCVQLNKNCTFSIEIE